jgi:crotonobetainyl-CoA:carnitine CoA-transferase CaiB-like acyl-CoA transferase
MHGWPAAAGDSLRSPHEKENGMSTSPPTAERVASLSGVTILDVTRVVAGPYCTMMLADLGATVIKVEHPSDPDFVRGFPPFADGIEGQGSGYFAQYNRHKMGISLDLKRPEGRALFLEMAAKADILMENFRPGTMEKLGLGYEVLKPLCPRLIYTSISGFGQSGPNSRRPAFDSTAQAAGGLWSMNGEADAPPVRVGSIIGDLAASFYATIATLAALRERERSGLGQRVDVAQQDSVVTLTENAIVNYTMAGIVATPMGNEHPFARPYGQYACKDGYVFFGSYSDKLWREACCVFGMPELADDPEIDTMSKRFDLATYERRLRPIIEGWFAAHTKAELEALAGDRIALTPVKSMDEVVADPHLAARNMFVPVQVGGKSVTVFGSPMHLSATPVQAHGAAPGLGQHNRAVYLDWLGIDVQRFDAMRADGTI